MSKGKILWLSDSPLTVTGYATISKNIMNRLTEKGWDCHFLAHNYVGQTLPPGITFKDGSKLNFEVIGIGAKPYSADLIEPKIRELQPDIFGVLLDTFMLYPWILTYNFAPARSVFYFPSDGGGGLPLRCEDILRKFGNNVAMARFGQRQVKSVYNIDTHYIPHAIDTKLFYPLSKEEKNILKAKYGLQNKFVVGTVARNQGRKMLDRTIKAFRLFADKCPEAMLFMHTDPDDLAQVFDLRELIKRYNLENRVVWSGMRYYNGVEYREMNNIYNIMDIFFLSTSGEGFGIPTIEAMSCSVPCIVTDYTTTQELLIEDGKCGEPVKCDVEITGSWNVERGVMDIKDAADKLELLWKNPELRKKYGEKGREKALKLYDWEIIADQWDKYFTELINK